MTRRRWWALRTRDDPDDVSGEAGPGKVLVPVRIEDGEAVESVWAEAKAAHQWDARRWSAEEFGRPW